MMLQTHPCTYWRRRIVKGGQEDKGILALLKRENEGVGSIPFELCAVVIGQRFEVPCRASDQHSEVGILRADS